RIPSSETRLARPRNVRTSLAVSESARTSRGCTRSKLPRTRRAVAGRSAMSAEERAQASVDNLLDVLDLDESSARTTEDIFTGRSHPMPTGRIYGGQVLGQSLLAAERTLSSDRAAHSMHGYFLRPGDSTQGVTISVDRIHDGRSF